MEEAELPTEQLQEEMHHQAHGCGQSWIMGVALTSALLAVLGSKIDFRRALKLPVAPKDEEKLAQYGEEQTKISGEAKEIGASSRHHLETHQVFARAVTFFQVAIGIAALTRKRRFWFVSMTFGVFGLGFLLEGFLK